ncbi:MAG: hypothetical protein KAS11_01110, partial [Candidatus Aenigmarchaeota archaeon]|nr:hypothetical protein [Candidatus Aenigmarchaeota archaeon]
SELHGEERKSKTHFETLQRNIISMQDRLLHKQETVDKELNDSLKEQGKRLGSDINAISSQFPSLRKKLSVHSSGLKSIMSKEQIDFKALNSDLNGVLSLLNQTTSEFHGEERKSKTHFELLKNNIKSMQTSILDKQKEGDTHIVSLLRNKTSEIDSKINVIVLQTRKLKNNLKSDDSKIESMIKDIGDENADISLLFSRLGDMDSYFHSMADVSKKKIEELKTLIGKTKKEVIEDSLENTGNLEKRLGRNIASVMKSFDGLSGSVIKLKSRTLLDAKALKKLSGKEDIDIKKIFERINKINTELSLQESTTLKDIDGLRSNIGSMKSYFDSAFKANISDIRKNLGAVSKKIPALRKKFSVHEKQLKMIADSKAVDMKNVSKRIDLLNSDISNIGKDFMTRNKISETSLSMLKSSISDLRKSMRHRNIDKITTYENLFKKNIASVRSEIKAIEVTFPELSERLAKYERKLSDMSKNENVSRDDLVEQIRNINDYIDSFIDKKTAKNEIKNVREKIKDVRSTISSSIDSDMVSVKDEIGSICESIGNLDHRLSEQDSNIGKIGGDVGSRVDSIAKKSDELSEGLYSKINEIESSLGGLKEEESVSDDSLLNRIGVLEERLNNIEGNEVVKLFSDVPSGKEFYFLSYDYAPTGLVARNVVEFIHIFKTMDPNIIAFHMRDGSNDFANWFFDVIGDADTAEKIKAVEVDYSDLGSIREQMLEILFLVVPFSIN